MNLKKVFCLFYTLWTFTLDSARADAPQLRVKTGISDLSIQAGSKLKGDKLKSLITFQPSVLWDFPSFSSRFGVHFLSEVNSPFGATPLSGIGVSAYYYLMGLSSGHDLSDDNILLQKSRPGPFLIASFTPVNININKFNDQASSNENFYFSAYVNDLLMGIGYDYPIRQNMLISAEIVLRNGSAAVSNSQPITYSGWSFFLTMATSYY
jgi:hypothetical protein